MALSLPAQQLGGGAMMRWIRSDPVRTECLGDRDPERERQGTETETGRGGVGRRRSANGGARGGSSDGWMDIERGVLRHGESPVRCAACVRDGRRPPPAT